METWNRPSNRAPEWCEANDIVEYLTVMPGMNPSTPTAKNTIPTARAAFCSEERPEGTPALVEADIKKSPFEDVTFCAELPLQAQLTHPYWIPVG
jgi:hypothetical protein